MDKFTVIDLHYGSCGHGSSDAKPHGAARFVTMSGEHAQVLNAASIVQVDPTFLPSRPTQADLGLCVFLTMP